MWKSYSINLVENSVSTQRWYNLQAITQQTDMFNSCINRCQTWPRRWNYYVATNDSKEIQMKVGEWGWNEKSEEEIRWSKLNWVHWMNDSVNTQNASDSIRNIKCHSKLKILNVNFCSVFNILPLDSASFLFFSLDFFFGSNGYFHIDCWSVWYLANTIWKPEWCVIFSIASAWQRERWEKETGRSS